MLYGIFVCLCSALFFSFLLSLVKSFVRNEFRALRGKYDEAEAFFCKINPDVALTASINFWRVASFVAFGAFSSVCIRNTANIYVDVALVAFFSLFLFAADFSLFKTAVVEEKNFIKFLPSFYVVYFAAFPFLFVISKFLSPFYSKSTKRMTEDDLMEVFERASEAGILEEKENEMLHNVLRLADTTASEIMVPRLDVKAVSKDADLRKAIDIALEHGFSRIPVYDGSIDKIVGVIHTKDMIPPLCDNEFERPVSDFMRKPMLVPGSRKIDELMMEMQSAKTALAVVIDEYGGTDGIVTLEDAVEEIVGDILDEYDKDSELIRQISLNSFIVAGRTLISELNESLEISLPEDLPDADFETISGYVYAELGRIPRAGETIETNGVRITVEKVVRHRITVLKLERLQDNK